MNTQSFTHCAMRCTHEQWEQQLKPILELIQGVKIEHVFDFEKNPYIVNNLSNIINFFSNVSYDDKTSHNRTVLETFDLYKFLDLSGINVVIQGNEDNADKIKQWWIDRGLEHYYDCIFDDYFYGIVDGTFDCYYIDELPKGTHIINPFAKPQYTIEQLIEKAGLNKDDIEIV